MTSSRTFWQYMFAPPEIDEQISNALKIMKQYPVAGNRHDVDPLVEKILKESKN